MALNSRNDCPNPYAATATTGAVTSASGGTAPLTQVTGLSSPWIKSTGFRTVRTGSGSFDYQLIAPLTSDQGAIAGQTWSGTIQWAVSATGPAVNVNFLAFDAAGTYVGLIQSLSISGITANTPVQTKVTGTLPASTRRIGIAVYVTSAPVGHAITLTAIRYDSVSDSNLSYADGSTQDWRWEGTTGSSTSILPILKSSSDTISLNESFQESFNNTQQALYGIAWDWEPSGLVTDSNLNYPADSGPNILQYTKDNGTSYMTTTNNRAEIVWAAGNSTTSQALYLDQPTSSVIKYMTAIFGFGPGTDSAQASIVMASWDYNHPQPEVPVKAQIHLAMSRTAWFYHVVDTLSNIILLKQGTFTSALVADWRRYTASVTISGNTATLSLPDGSTDTVTDTRIGSFPGTTNCFEYYRTNNTYTANIACYRMYAGPGISAGNPLGKDAFTLNDISLLDTAGGNKLGVDTALATDTASVVASVVASDLANQTDARQTYAALTRSETAGTIEEPTSAAATSSTDLATFTESQSMFQGLLKDVSDTFSSSEQASILAYFVRTDTAATSDVQQEAASFYKADLHVVNDLIQSQNILASEVFSLFEYIPPRFDYLASSDTFTALDIGASNRPVMSSDLFDFLEQANVFEKQRITEDPFTYPVSYYGSERIRVIAQDHFTREFIHWDLPVDNIQLTFTLSGPNLFSGTISTEMESLLNLNPPLMPDRTWIHIEQGNTIIASFILTPFIDNPQNQTRQIEGEGFAAYPSWIYYEGDQYIRIQTDPADVIRYIWDHVQSFTDGNLGVKVWPTVTPVRVGYPNTSVTFTTKEMNEVSITGEPYNLNFWSVINCGEEINRICQETPIEYWEYSQWNEFKTDVEHYIVLGYPRVGRKRTDLVFREGENLVQLIPSYQETQENYASDVFVIGAGEGPGAVRAKASGRIGRLRKTNIIQDQTISNKARAQSIANFEFNRIAKSRFLIENILVDTTHTNARWGTFIAGDDIFIQGTIPYIGHVQDWYRIVNYTFEPYARVATLNLEPSDSFTYGATFFDQFADLPHEGFAVLTDADFGDGEGEIDIDQQEQINIKLCQQQGIEAFNKKNVVNGFAYAYSKVGSSINYIMKNIPIVEVIEPWQLIIGRTTQGYLITGANVYLVASNGTIGQAPESTAAEANPSFTPTGGTVTAHAPYDPALQIAAREYYNAFVGNIRINADLTFMGISANAERWRSTIGYLFYTVYGKQYNYGINSPGGDFAFMVSNISRNTGFMV